MLLQCETYQLHPDKPTHGYSGPLKVSYGGFSSEVGEEFLNVAAQYDKTRGLTDDVNNLYDCNKYGVSAPSVKASRSLIFHRRRNGKSMK